MQVLFITKMSYLIQLLYEDHERFHEASAFPKTRVMFRNIKGKRQRRKEKTNLIQEEEREPESEEEPDSSPVVLTFKRPRKSSLNQDDEARKK